VLQGSDFATTVRVKLTVAPGTAGFDQFTVAAVDYDTHRPVPAATSLRFTMPGRPDLGASTLALAPHGPGIFTASGANLSIAGTWTVTVVVQRPTGGVEVQFQVTTRAPPERITVDHNPGLPDVYTLHLAQLQSVQVYLDPGHPGFDELHVTFIGAGGQEVPMAGATVAASPGGALPVRRLDDIGHFVADLAGASRRSYRFDVVGTTRAGDRLAGTFTIGVH
jgi:hypothetical protein